MLCAIFRYLLNHCIFFSPSANVNLPRCVYSTLTASLAMINTAFKRQCTALFLTVIGVLGLRAQVISGVSTRYSNDLTEWEFFAWEQLSPEDIAAGIEPEEVLIGRLAPLWPMRMDLRDWQYELDGERGSIRQKWSTDKTHWELNDAESRITMQPTWPGQVRSWRITDNNISINLECRYGNVADEWLVNDPKYGSFFMYTLREGDPRDWNIKNKLNEEVPKGMQVALLFLVLYFTTNPN